MHLRLTHYVLLMGILFSCKACSKDSLLHPPLKIHMADADTTTFGRKQEGEASRQLSRASMLDPLLRVSSRLITAARHSEYAPARPVFEWEIEVCEDEAVVQPFVHREGSIIVCSGAFRVAETEAGLAALLSHELAHALKHCPSAAPELCRRPDSHKETLFTIEQEIEADGIGMNLMADAGYDPSELLLIWKRMKESHRERGDGLLVHITYDRRMDHIKGKLPDALRLYAETHRAPQRPLPVR
jgi:hypothetical protein